MHSIFKQSFWLIMAQGLARVIGFLYTIYIARSLGVEEFGIIATALAYFSIFSVISDFGFNRYLIKEISQDHTRSPLLLFNVTMLRLLFTCFLFAVLSVIVYLLDSDSIRRGVILLGLLAVLPQAISLSIDAVFVAFRKLQFSSLAILMLSISTSLVGVLMINSGFGALGVIIAVMVGQLIYLLTLVLLSRYLKIHFKFDEELTGAKKILKGALPFGVLGVLGLLYFRIDTILLSYLRGNFDAGIYGAAYRFLEAIVFIPAAASTALFPVTASLISHDKTKVYNLYKNTSKYLLLLGLFLSLIFVFILPVVIITFLPQYSQSITVIKILALTIPFLFLIAPQGVILMSDDRYIKDLVWISVFNLLLNLLLNFLFIPQYGYLASAWITVVSDVVGFLIFFIYIRKRFKGF